MAIGCLSSVFILKVVIKRFKKILLLGLTMEIVNLSLLS